MKVTYQWLKEFVDIPETPQQLGARFTNLGMAVDALEQHGEDWLFELDVASNRPDRVDGEEQGSAHQARSLALSGPSQIRK